MAIAKAKQAKVDGATTILTDYTCLGAGRHEIGKMFFQEEIFLDELFSIQVENCSSGNTMDDNFVWCAKQIADGKPIKSVVVVENCIGDHSINGRRPCIDWVKDQLTGLFSGATVEVVETLDEALVLADNPETLLVADRHCGVKKVMSREDGWYNSLNNWEYSSMLYMLPPETCVGHLINRGVVDFEFDLEEMRQRCSS